MSDVLHVVRLTVPAGTPRDEPVRKVVSLDGRALTGFYVYFPPGCCLLVGVRLKYGQAQLFPSPPGEWLRGHGYLVGSRTWWPFPESPCKLTLEAYNEDSRYDHTLEVYVDYLARGEIDLAEELRRLRVLYELVAATLYGVRPG